MFAVRDGVRVAHLPDVAGPFPATVEHTPYGRDRTSRSELTAPNPIPVSLVELASYFITWRYAVLYQDTRGRHGSEGCFVKYLSDAEDGYDTCAWLVRQPWCDGRICTMGLSYPAHTQAALGCRDAPGVVAQALDCGGFPNSWLAGIRQSSAFELKLATRAYKQAILSPEADADPTLKAALEAQDIRDWQTRLPSRPDYSPLRHHPDYKAYPLDQWSHGAFNEYWQQLGIWAEGSHSGYSKADCVHLSSWFDTYPLIAIANYSALKRASRSPQRLIPGPWTHGDRSASTFGDVDFGPDAPIDSWAGHWRQYRRLHDDIVIKEIPNRKPPVRLFIMGGGSGRRTRAGYLAHGGHWLSFSDWPPPEAAPTPYHLRDHGRLDIAAPNANGEPISFDCDPFRPVITIGGTLTSMEPVARGGTWDQVESPEFFFCAPPYLPLAFRDDVPVFQSSPLAKPVRVADSLEASLCVATGGLDTDSTATLVDVHTASPAYPQGYAMLLADGICPSAAPKTPPVPGSAVPEKYPASPSLSSRPRPSSCPTTISGSTFHQATSQVRCQYQH
jgi:putative CocE/NonD family hydrolase